MNLSEGGLKKGDRDHSRMLSQSSSLKEWKDYEKMKNDLQRHGLGGGAAIKTGEPTGHPHLVTSFCAVPKMKVQNKGNGLMSLWNQCTGTFVAGGNSKSFFLWDLEYEKIKSSLRTGSDHFVTALSGCNPDKLGTTELGSSPFPFAGGFIDGSLRIYDPRTHSQGPVTSLRGHKNWIVNLSSNTHSKHGSGELISGSYGGDVKLWDIRSKKCTKKIVDLRTKLMALTVHPNLPVLASGSTERVIKVFTLDGETVCKFKHHEGFSAHRFAPISCLTFHPNKYMLAVGSTDSTISVYGTREEF